jgi:hypothetical protein
MKTQKSADLDDTSSPSVEAVIRDGEVISSSKSLQAEVPQDEPSAEANIEGINRRDRRCRKILDTIG